MKDKKLNSEENKNSSPDKMEGALFLVVGFVVVLTLGVIISLRFSNTDPIISPDKAESVTLVSPMTMPEKIQAKLPVQKDKMITPATYELEGTWYSTFGKGAIAILTFSGKNFEMVYSASSDARIRKYSRGYFKYDENLGKLTLYPSKEAGAPKPEKGIQYKILTMRHYDIFLSRSMELASLYFTADESTILTKNYYPLFSYADYGGAPVLKFIRSPVNFGEQR